MQAQLDPNGVYTRPVGSVGSQQCLYETCGLNCISIVFIRDLQAQYVSIVFIGDMQDHFDLYSGYTRPVGSVGSQQCLCETCRLSRFLQCFYDTCRLSISLQCLYKTCRLRWIPMVFYETCSLRWIPIVFIRDLQVQLDSNSVYSRPVGSLASLQCLYETYRLSRSKWCLFETCRLTWISIVFIRDMQTQLDPNNVYTRPVGSVDLYSVYTRPVGSVYLYSVDTRHVVSLGSLQCLYETCRLTWISIVFIRDLQAHLVLYSVYTRHVGSIGSLQCLYETCRLSWFPIMFIRDLQAQQISIVFIRDLQAQYISIVLIRDMQAHLDLHSVYTRPIGSVGSQQCVYKTCRLSCIPIVFIRDLQAHLDLYSVYTRHVDSVGSQ